MATILRRLIEQGTQHKAVAERLGRSRQWLTNVLGGEKAGAEVCLRLARQERLNPLELLRSEGHDELADELQAAGFNASESLSDDDRALLAAYRAMRVEQQRHFRALAESVVHPTPETAPAPRPERPRRRRR